MPISRAEVSLDDGKTWLLCNITQRATPNAYGKHWAWVWWEVEVPLGECNVKYTRNANAMVSLLADLLYACSACSLALCVLH